MRVSVSLCSEPLHSALLYSVHGYAQVHTSIYIYIIYIYRYDHSSSDKEVGGEGGAVEIREWMSRSTVEIISSDYLLASPVEIIC